MEAIGLVAAKCLVSAHAVTGAEIRCLDGRKWIIILHSGNSFVLKSDRQNPRRFATLETAVAEVRHLGFQRCEVNVERWDGKAPRRNSAAPLTQATSE